MSAVNAFDRQLLTNMLLRDGIATAPSELAWLQIEVDLTKQRADPARTNK